MAEPAGPYVVTVGQWFIRPPGSVPDSMVVAAEGRQVVNGGRSVLRPRVAMIEIARFGGHPASGEDASRLAGFDVPALAGVRSPPGGPIVDGLVGFAIGQGPSPFGAWVVFGNLTGNVGDDWPVSG